jgi:predicted GH43/DUF377 family glycosyl hydrolase
MKWIKQGHLFKPEPGHEWMKTHAQVPTVLLKKDRLRIYFSSRPQKTLSLTSFVDLDINDLSKVIYVNQKPILQIGTPGTFDEHGIMPASIIEKDGRVYLYYSGWQRAVGVPYNNYTGLAISKDGGQTFFKYNAGPIIDRTPKELYSATSPCVYFEKGVWHMWYCSGTDWKKINGRKEHTYDIKYASSQDGKNWVQQNKTVIFQRDEYEAITRPTVIKMDGLYHMWFCYRGSKSFRDGDDSYRMGYAYSVDLVNWERDDKKAGIDVSANGWDSQMIAYPCVAKIKDQIYMFYNGNAFGEEGFGYAILEK